MKIQEIMQFISCLRKSKKEAVDKLFFDISKFGAGFSYVERRRDHRFFCSGRKIAEMLFASTNEKELNSLLKELPAGTVMDYITKEKTEDFCWTDVGFGLYRTLIRYTDPNWEDESCPKSKRTLFLEQFYDENVGEFATVEDAEELYELLYKIFDVRVSRLPSMQQLIEMIEKKWVLLYREQGRVIAFLMYQIEGRKYYGYQIYNEGTADITYNLERKATQYAKSAYQVKSSYGWVEIDNFGANDRCESGNFDGTYDYIFVKS